MNAKTILTFMVILFSAQAANAAVGCTLNDPDRDIKRLFPKATNYKTDFVSIKEDGDKDLVKEIELKLKDKLEPLYESVDVPYAYYTILQKKEVIGYVHGVNQKGMYGGIQIILATDPNGIIMDCYYQKLTSPESKKFRDKKFTKQFLGLSLLDFYSKDLHKKIHDPSKDSAQDYLATMRGIRKNLILHDEFILKNKYDKHFYRIMKEKEAENEKKAENNNKKQH